ncbi:hypothetical protein PFISCL1PPCAC_2641 [Pristionchus fissidentatus]|uniref:C2H2-type domain-containing protein n=1 Tax=Pristionchus fissidentatus TaxID=1538716 RepID=A0AAV5UW46_9BILA|nr:hypothetical protein PFISCL1PPCAC_2641 [Pristionchus fissidentatus]
MDRAIKRYTSQAMAAAEMVAARTRDESTIGKSLLHALNAVVMPHVRVAEGEDDELMMYQSLRQSQFQVLPLFQTIARVEQDVDFDSDEMISLLNLSIAVATTVDRLQRKAIVRCRQDLTKKMGERRGKKGKEKEQRIPMAAVVVERRETPLPSPSSPGPSKVNGIDSIDTSSMAVPSNYDYAPSHSTPLFDNAKEVKEESQSPSSLPFTVRARPRRDEQQPSTSREASAGMPSIYSELIEDQLMPKAKRNRIGDKVKNGDSESFDAPPNKKIGVMSEVKEEIMEEEEKDAGVGLINLFSVSSDNPNNLNLEVPWDEVQYVDEDSNIGQPSDKSCPFCTKKMVAKRSIITKHVRQAHKDLWLEFAPIHCTVPECDYRSTNVTTMGGHKIASHAQQWKQWKNDGFFNLPRGSRCPFCPSFPLESLAAYRQHIMAHHDLDVTKSKKTLRCNGCQLEYQFTSDLFTHWAKRGSSCTTGASVINVK